MRTFFIHPLVAAIIFSVLLMGALGAFVLLPIFCINWLWNAVVSGWTLLPVIAPWQACLLYVAFACLIYIFGLVRIEFKTENLD
jgi:hypothetical protein